MLNRNHLWRPADVTNGLSNLLVGHPPQTSKGGLHRSFFSPRLWRGTASIVLCKKLRGKISKLEEPFIKCVLLF